MYECLPKCVSIYHMYAVPAEARRGHLISGTGVLDGCAPPGSKGAESPGLLQEQHVQSPPCPHSPLVDLAI